MCFSNRLYCIEKFYCCRIPGTKWNYLPRKANWWTCFDNKNLCKVPHNTWMTGLHRNHCYHLYCLEYARYTQPVTNLVTRFYALGNKNYRSMEGIFCYIKATKSMIAECL